MYLLDRLSVCIIGQSVCQSVSQSVGRPNCYVLCLSGSVSFNSSTCSLVCLSVGLPVGRSFSWLDRMSVCQSGLSVGWSVCLPTRLTVDYLIGQLVKSVSLSGFLSDCLSCGLFICLSVSLLVHLSVDCELISTQLSGSHTPGLN